MNAITKPATAIQPRQTGPVLQPQNFDQLLRFADMVAQSGLVPRDYQGKPANVMVAVQMGSELGLAPMQSLQSIAVINGRPGVWGDGLIGLCRQSDLCEDIQETYEGEGESRTAVCIARRRGSSPVEARFSVTDAKKAGLWGKQGPWSQYPERMLRNRARGFALRDAFPDVLRGLKTVEELQDFPAPKADTFRGTTLDAQPGPDRAAPQQRQRDAVDDDVIPPLDIQPRALSAGQVLTRINAAQTMDDLHAITGDKELRDWMENKLRPAKPGGFETLQKAIADRYQALSASEMAPETADEALPA